MAAPERARDSTATGQEHVVLLDDAGQKIGYADKYVIHTADTPLHLAFSCYLFNEQGELLMTRRALSKLTWAGVWTNSVCGHPAPGESTEDAVARRADLELGARITDLRPVLPDFRYRAVDASGIVENEICPVFTATIASDLAPHPDEVAQWEWVSLSAVLEGVTLTPWAFSPWMVMQVPRIRGQVQQAASLARHARARS